MKITSVKPEDLVGCTLLKNSPLKKSGLINKSLPTLCLQNLILKRRQNMPDSQPATSFALRDFSPYMAEKDEEYMNDDQKDHFRGILLSWKKELMEEVDRTVTHMKDEAANFPDPADRASQEEEFSLELRTRDRERKLIKKIDKTIELIKVDDYGYCDACGVEIGIRRLEARPTATQCVDCKTLDEIKEKQTMGN